MRRRETIIAVFWIVLGSVVAIWSSTFPFGSSRNLGPAIFPFALGLVALLLGCIIYLQTILKQQDDPTFKLTPLIPNRAALKRVAIVLLAMLIAAVFLETIGFVLTAFCLMLCLFRNVEPGQWKVDLFYVLIFTLGSYILFQVLLKVQLPKGYLGL